MSPFCSHPQIRRNFLSDARRSNKALVVGILYTALVTNARATAARSFGGRPRKLRLKVVNLSIRISSNVVTSFCSFSVSSPSSSSSQGKRLLCILNQYWDNVFTNAISDLLPPFTLILSCSMEIVISAHGYKIYLYIAFCKRLISYIYHF